MECHRQIGCWRCHVDVIGLCISKLSCDSVGCVSVPDVVRQGGRGKTTVTSPRMFLL